MHTYDTEYSILYQHNRCRRANTYLSSISLPTHYNLKPHKLAVE